MPIVHSLPRQDERGNQLLAIYHGRLRRHWGPVDQGLARCLDALGLGTGWSAQELALLSPEVRCRGISLAKRKSLHRLLNPSGYPMSRNLLRDKAAFARHAAAHDLPLPLSYDPLAGGLEEWLAARNSIIAKPGFSSKGRGIEAFKRQGSQWQSADGPIQWRQLLAHLRRILGRHGVIQELLSPHQELGDISPGGLPTMRIVTCRNESGALEACVAILKLAGGGTPVDNFNAGGIAVRLDADGSCTAAFRARADPAGIAHHPATGAAILGRQVPDFNEAMALALRAHSTIPDGFTLVGWDIGMTNRGPLIVEGNWNPGTQLIQVAEGKGIDDLRLGELYRYHLERIPDDQWRAAKVIEW